MPNVSIGEKGTSASSRLAPLDGVRGLAILGVVLHHYGVHAGGWLDWGPVAPTVFFMLSGFFVTGSLFRMKEGNQINWSTLQAFHFRRLARLLPAFYILLAVGWIAGFEEFRDGLAWHALFLSNVKMAWTGEWAGSLSHLWSLANQEQFYLLCPLVFLLPARWIPHALFGVIGLALGFRLACLQWGAPEMVRWLLLPASLDSFAAGALVAIGLRHREKLIPAGWGAVALGLATASWFISRGLRHLDFMGSMWIAFVDVFEIFALACCLILFVQYPGARLAKIFAFPPLAFVGRISYGVYLWHIMVAMAVSSYLDRIGLDPREDVLLRALIMTVLSIIVAWFCWIGIERPFIAWAKNIDPIRIRLAAIWRRIAKFFRDPSEA